MYLLIPAAGSGRRMGSDHYYHNITGQLFDLLTWLGCQQVY